MVAGKGDLITFTLSDVSGRPRALVAPFDGSSVGEPRRVPEFDPDIDADVVALSWSPDGRWLAAQLAPDGGERTRVRLVGARRRRRHRAAARAVTLGAWSPAGYRLGVTIFGATASMPAPLALRGAATGRPAWSTSATARPPCSPRSRRGRLRGER